MDETVDSERAPSVFIMYSQESEQHLYRVRNLAERLMHKGVKVCCDIYTDNPPENWQLWMKNQFVRADRVVIVFSQPEGASEKHGAGAVFELNLARTELYEKHGRNERFFFTIFRSSDMEYIPLEFRSFGYELLETNDGFEKLTRKILQDRLLPPFPPPKLAYWVPSQTSPVPQGSNAPLHPVSRPQAGNGVSTERDASPSFFGFRRVTTLIRRNCRDPRLLSELIDAGALRQVLFGDFSYRFKVLLISARPGKFDDAREYLKECIHPHKHGSLLVSHGGLGVDFILRGQFSDEYLKKNLLAQHTNEHIRDVYELEVRNTPVLRWVPIGDRTFGEMRVIDAESTELSQMMAEVESTDGDVRLVYCSSDLQLHTYYVLVTFWDNLSAEDLRDVVMSGIDYVRDVLMVTNVRNWEHALDAPRIQPGDVAAVSAVLVCEFDKFRVTPQGNFLPHSFQDLLRWRQELLTRHSRVIRDMRILSATVEVEYHDQITEEADVRYRMEGCANPLPFATIGHRTAPNSSLSCPQDNALVVGGRHASCRLAQVLARAFAKDGYIPIYLDYTTLPERQMDQAAIDGRTEFQNFKGILQEIQYSLTPCPPEFLAPALAKSTANNGFYVPMNTVVRTDKLLGELSAVDKPRLAIIFDSPGPFEAYDGSSLSELDTFRRRYRERGMVAIVTEPSIRRALNVYLRGFSRRGSILVTALDRQNDEVIAFEELLEDCQGTSYFKVTPASVVAHDDDLDFVIFPYFASAIRYPVRGRISTSNSSGVKKGAGQYQASPVQN
jgi:hypothetical protein